MLDGLNEMSLEHVPMIEQWIARHTDAVLIVSCRKLDYSQRSLPLHRVEIAPLDVRRIYDFIGNYFGDEDRDRLFWALCEPKVRLAWRWYKNSSVGASFETFWFGKTEFDPGWVRPEKITMKATQDLVRAVDKLPKALPGMLGVVTNPFLLFLVIVLYTKYGEPPLNRAQLFNDFVQQ